MSSASNTQFKLHSSLTAKLLSCQFWLLWLKYYLSREHLPPDALTTHASCSSCLFDNDFQCCCFSISVAISFFFFPTICWQFLDQGLTFDYVEINFKTQNEITATTSVNWTFLLLWMTSSAIDIVSHSPNATTSGLYTYLYVWILTARREVISLMGVPLNNKWTAYDISESDRHARPQALPPPDVSSVDRLSVPWHSGKAPALLMLTEYV